VKLPVELTPPSIQRIDARSYNAVGRGSRIAAKL